MIDGRYFIDVVLLDGKLECGGEEQDGVVGWLRAGGGDQRVLWAMVAVQGHVQVADAVDWCVADHTSLL